jgi:hypothetical protein
MDFMDITDILHTTLDIHHITTQVSTIIHHIIAMLIVHTAATGGKFSINPQLLY